MLSFTEQLLYKCHASVAANATPPPDHNFKKLVEMSKEEVIKVIKQHTGIVLDTPTSKGGTTDTGNSAWRFFSHEVVPALMELFPQDCLDNILPLHLHFAVILRVINSKQPQPQRPKNPQHQKQAQKRAH